MAMATLSRRSAKPGDHLELVVTVHNAIHPVILLPDMPSGLTFKLLRKPVQLSLDEGMVWLWRYRVKPTLCGDYEISPLHVMDGAFSSETKSLYLHVSPRGELPPLSAKELSAGVNISQSLSEEVLKAAPQPTPKPTPSPTPRDSRDLGTRTLSTCWKGLQAFWNYPGK